MGKCHTESDEKWECKLLPSERIEGHFTVKEGDNGFFTGVFEDKATGKSEPILGRCNGAQIYFLRNGDKPIHYLGNFVSDEEIRNGARLELPGFQLEDKRVIDKKEDDEEWEGTKVT